MIGNVTRNIMLNIITDRLSKGESLEVIFKDYPMLPEDDKEDLINAIKSVTKDTVPD